MRIHQLAALDLISRCGWTGYIATWNQVKFIPVRDVPVKAFEYYMVGNGQRQLQRAISAHLTQRVGPGSIVHLTG
jgi:hypothetical protein